MAGWGIEEEDGEETDEGEEATTAPMTAPFLFPVPLGQRSTGTRARATRRRSRCPSTKGARDAVLSGPLRCPRSRPAAGSFSATSAAEAASAITARASAAAGPSPGPAHASADAPAAARPSTRPADCAAATSGKATRASADGPAAAGPSAGPPRLRCRFGRGRARLRWRPRCRGGFSP
eukprot:4356893-Pyramimonas_sp.AAC.1